MLFVFKKKKHINKIFLSLSIFFILDTPLVAEEVSMTLARDAAKAAIDACWTKTLADRSSTNTQIMRKGNWDTVLCMQNNLSKLINESLITQNKPLAEKFNNEMETAIWMIGKLYWSLYNEHDKCVQGCGSMYQVIPNTQTAKIIEHLIYDFYDQVARYNPEYFVNFMNE